MPRALREFRRSYELYASIEDFFGCATLLINQSRINRRLGDLAAATAAIDRAVEIDHANLQEEIAFEKALVLLAVPDLSAAQRWAHQALLLAKEQNRGRSLNLLGRISLAAGNPSESREFAGQALTSLAPEAKLERANSARLLGRIALGEGRAEQALEYFGRALQADKDAGLSPRILKDLTGLAEAEALRDNNRVALGYLRRALRVSRSSGNERESARLFKQHAAHCSQHQELQCEGPAEVY
jgi:tetratricopeptide (TPR) repeat protein